LDYGIDSLNLLFYYSIFYSQTINFISFASTEKHSLFLRIRIKLSRSIPLFTKREYAYMYFGLIVKNSKEVRS